MLFSNMIDMYLHLDFTQNEKFILNLQHFALNIIHISKKKIFQFPLAFVKFTSIIEDSAEGVLIELSRVDMWNRSCIWVPLVTFV